MYSELEEKLGAKGWYGSKWLSDHLGISPRQVSNYRDGTTEAPKLVLDKMQQLINEGKTYVSGK